LMQKRFGSCPDLRYNTVVKRSYTLNQDRKSDDFHHNNTIPRAAAFLVHQLQMFQ
jgi:hypothetical protein